MNVAPAFHETWEAPRGVAWALPGGPGSARTGPKVTRPADWSQVRCLGRLYAGSGLGGAGFAIKRGQRQGGRRHWLRGGRSWARPWRRGAFPVAVALPCFAGRVDWVAVARRMAGRGEAMAAVVTTTVEAAATVSRTARRRADSRLRWQWLACARCDLPEPPGRGVPASRLQFTARCCRRIGACLTTYS